MDFVSTDGSYADELLSSAESLYAFADKYRGIYSDSIWEANEYYRSVDTTYRCDIIQRMSISLPEVADTSAKHHNEELQYVVRYRL